MPPIPMPLLQFARERLPPRVAMRLRAEKNRWNLAGLHGPARTLVNLVPEGRLAVDAGANAGLYSYWIARRARHVHAFEPQPSTFRRLAASVPANVTCHQVALSDQSGRETLHVPFEGSGEATLRDTSSGISDLEVVVEPLDVYEFADVGFIKIDVEGHEEALLRGAIRTIERSRPVLFVEIEERHNPGGLARVREVFSSLRYECSVFAKGREQSWGTFELERDQLALTPEDPGYVNNFLFRPQ